MFLYNMRAWIFIKLDEREIDKKIEELKKEFPDIEIFFPNNEYDAVLFVNCDYNKIKKIRNALSKYVLRTSTHLEKNAGAS